MSRMLSSEEKQRLKEKANLRCEKCGEIFELEYLDVHHTKDEKGTLQVLCRKCHIEEHKPKTEKGIFTQESNSGFSNLKTPPIIVRKKQRSAGRPRIDRKIVFSSLALNLSKKEIKQKTGIAERTYFHILEEWNRLSSDEQLKFREDAEKNMKAKEQFIEYDFVQKWVATLQSERVRSWKTRFSMCERVWLILQKKDPQNWTIEEIKLKVVPELRKSMKSIFQYLVSIRSLRPDFKQNLSTKREKGAINTSWKPKFEKLMENNRQLLKVFLSSGDLEAQTLKHVHITLGCREGEAGYVRFKAGTVPETEIGGILGLRWEKLSWNNKTIDCYESKTGEGFEWQDCPLDLFGNTTLELLSHYWESLGKPETGRIFNIAIDRLAQIYDEGSQAVGIKINPHMARKIHASLCHEADVPLEIVAGEVPHGIVGVGWEDLTTLKKFYLSYSKKKIQTAKQSCQTISL